MAYRLTCCVPFCKHTRGDRKNDPITEDMEWICHKHWMAIPLRRRKVWYRHWRWAYGGPDRKGMTFGEIMRQRGGRGWSLAANQRIWDCVKREAIERAVGL